ncbi:MAG: hypothetical protein DI565_15460 [Ancylobacter novellus]|uniref:Uncharacterized protein n=1 Tax=Ancylobacter novellus TaxID=921 RepID=A0A2W5KAN1_ANCNO|nr:MAG: hypothetical protein DI565_15460 [Ancylobacter novellus]
MESGDFMKRGATCALAAGAFALTACQTTGTGVQYVKERPGPDIQTARAQCEAWAAKASHVVIGIGGPEVIAGGLIASAILTGVRRAQAFEYCMTAQGYRKVDARTAAQPAPAPAPPPQTKKPTPAKTTKKAPVRAG